MPVDLFESSKLKIARAEEHLSDLKGRVDRFLGTRPYHRVIEPHDEKPDFVVHKVRLIKTLPSDIGVIAGEIAGHLRSALDNAAYATAIASKSLSTTSTAFPFAGSVEGLTKTIKGRSKDIPPQIQSLFCGFQPYLGGDDLLWALNEICNGDKHKIVTPVGQGAITTGINVQATGYVEMPESPTWDSAKNEMELLTLGPDAKFEYDFSFRLFIAFVGIKVVDGKPIIEVLHSLGYKVASIAKAIEAECLRLGYI